MFVCDTQCVYLENAQKWQFCARLKETQHGWCNLSLGRIFITLLGKMFTVLIQQKILPAENTSSRKLLFAYKIEWFKYFVYCTLNTNHDIIYNNKKNMTRKKFHGGFYVNYLVFFALYFL